MALTIWTYDWVPQMPRGYVRDIRLRWAAEEAGLAYNVATVPAGVRGPEHLARQPFGQVPFLEDGDIRLFESGACLLHLAEKSEVLMPRDPAGRAETLQWLFRRAELGRDRHCSMVVHLPEKARRKPAGRLDAVAIFPA